MAALRKTQSQGNPGWNEQKVQAMIWIHSKLDFTFQIKLVHLDRQTGDIAVKGEQYRLQASGSRKSL